MPFDSPNYTQLPNDLLGDWNKPSLMSDMSGCELKVVLAICRLTFGYHRRKVRAALPILMQMTGLSKQGVINGTKAAEERGLIQRVSQAGRGKIATWEVVTTEKVNDLDLFKNGQNNGPFEEEKVKDLDSKGQQSRHMKESSKEIDSKQKGASPEADYLTDVFNGNVQMREGEKLIQRADWQIPDPDHQQAIAAFLEASHLPIPSKRDRGDWLKSIGAHIEVYGTSRLENLYPAVIAQMRDSGLTISRPGSVTNNMADYWALHKDNGSEPQGQPVVPGFLED